EATPNDDYVCTCGGLVEKCLLWTGNGAQIQLDYVESSDPHRWEGTEVIPDAVGGGPIGQQSCDFNAPPEDAETPVSLEIDDDTCTWTGRRNVPACGFAPLTAYGGGQFSTGSATRSVEAVASTWGPLVPFGGTLTLDDWTTALGFPDPGFSNSPPEGYA